MILYSVSVKYIVGFVTTYMYVLLSPARFRKVRLGRFALICKRILAAMVS